MWTSSCNRLSYWHVHHSRSCRIQSENVQAPAFWNGVLSHLSQPEGFILLGGYLSGTWMFNLMPKSYYSWDGGVNIVMYACRFVFVLMSIDNSSGSFPAPFL
uniref:Uncharacterized protein n=1 Tax=Cryptomonas curvata TaxID=233186 RepID=A0A7S0MFF9_9CRYP|mmetsp:Transcript_35259/g.73842  ORF Transcript_35259/g.73842 Transcript_35259/m.73842 type:complete len:102 (+) Transcript_35259:223-528(+)